MYVERELGRRPLLNDGETATLGSIPPAEERAGEDEPGFVLPAEKKAEEDEPAAVLPAEERAEEDDPAAVLPAEPSMPEGDDAAEKADPLRLLLGEAVRPSDPE